jgi:hypothetical protein
LHLIASCTHIATRTRKNKEERREKRRSEMCLEEELDETARARRTTISQNKRMTLQTSPRETNAYTITKEDTTRESTKDLNQEIYPFATVIFESR